MGNLPPGLAGPVEVALARAVEHLPGLHALPGGCVFEPKWDGYRAVVGPVVSRTGRSLSLGPVGRAASGSRGAVC